jgi:hypothetical protein
MVAAADYQWQQRVFLDLSDLRGSLVGGIAANAV